LVSTFAPEIAVTAFNTQPAQRWPKLYTGEQQRQPMRQHMHAKMRVAAGLPLNSNQSAWGISFHHSITRGLLVLYRTSAVNPKGAHLLLQHASPGELR
jgi:hypothetical protein